MKIVKNKMVVLTYDLQIDDSQGELIEQATLEKPLQFLFGAGVMLPKFEEYLLGYKQGDEFEIKLSKNEAYGELNNDAIIELPKHVFFADGKFDNELVKVGNAVPMMSNDGQRLSGLVLEVNDETVKMDFNHPLAGEDLYFKGSVVEVRDASDEEIAQMFSGGCGCGSSYSESDSCSDGGSGGCGCSC